MPANDVVTLALDSEIVFNFSNKTDTNLTIGYTIELKSFATKSVSDIDEGLLSISTGYGKKVRGSNNVFGYNY